MVAFYPSFTALAVSALYLYWQSYAATVVRRGRTLQERVAYLVWRAAGLSDESTQASGNLPPGGI